MINITILANGKGVYSMNLSELLLEEFKDEAEKTKEALSRIPEGCLTFRPHEKSMSIGQLGLHIALLPGELTVYFSELIREVPTVPLPEASSVSEILDTFEHNRRITSGWLTEWGTEELFAEWQMKQNGEILMKGPRYTFIRSLVLNHWYHHRGQLTLYLRLLEVPVPGLYGSSADEE